MAKVYLLAGMGALIVVLGWQLLSAHQRIGELEEGLATQAQETREAADANESNQAVIVTLRERIDRMTAERASEAAERERVLLEREAELEDARATARRLQAERDDESETNLQCAEYNQLVMADFCPTGAQQLRERSRGESRHEDGNR